MAGHYAPHGGNMWASARIRESHRSAAAPPPPTFEHASSLQRSQPARVASALQRWLRTHGAPDAVELLRAIGARTRNAFDDAELAASSLATHAPPQLDEVPPQPENEWTLWRFALRAAFWMVFAAFDALRWVRSVRSRAERRLKTAQRQVGALQSIDSARDYATWADAATELDILEGRTRWKCAYAPPRSMPGIPEDGRSTGRSYAAAPHGDAIRAIAAVCDLDMLSAKLGELSRLYASGDMRGLAFALRASLQRNYAGVCHPELSNHSRIGTARVVEDYVHIVSYLLVYIAQSDNASGPTKAEHASDASSAERVCGIDDESRLLSVENKLLMFNEARIAYGRTALMLSGGASMGINHLGVVKALLDQNLMPKVVCGTSAGALVASIVGIFEDDALLGIIESDNLYNPLKQQPFSFRYFDDHTSILGSFRRLVRTGVIQDVRMLQDCLRRNFGDITFQEAYMRTRRILNITVCAVRSSSDPPMLLNYLTAPHVLVWSAASASCALPLVFAPVELVAKGYDGRLVPYHPHGVKWIDGSISSDIPLARIGELFNVNHFIVSQTNPHIIPRGTPFLKTRIAMLIKSELQFRYWQALQLNLVPRFLAAIFPHFMQPYEGDITIMPEIHPSDLRRLLCNPTLESVKDTIRRGEKQTFPFLDRIRRQCIIEKALDASVEHVARMHRGEDGISTSSSVENASTAASTEQSTRKSKRLKRGNSLFGRVPSWLWLDATSLLGAAPAAMASRITSRGSTVEPNPTASAEDSAKMQEQQSESVPVQPVQDREDERSVSEDVNTPKGDGSRWQNAGRHRRRGSKLGLGMSELEQMWVEFGVHSRTERTAVETEIGFQPRGVGGDGNETRSDESEEERIMC